jgi:hypothetical protein
MYRWVEDSVTEEAFEDARKRRLERIVRELDEDSLRELSRLIREVLRSNSFANPPVLSGWAAAKCSIASTSLLYSSPQAGQRELFEDPSATYG